MDKRNDIIAGAERIFETQGFRGPGVDGILAPSRASTRTLYKHFGNRDGLVIAVLERRHNDFMARLYSRGPDADPIGDLFDIQEQWMRERGSKGCMLMRARGEYAGANSDIAELVTRQKQEFEREVAKRVEATLGKANAELATQIWLLFEGATATASISSQPVVDMAKRAARALVALARKDPE
ncbi:TetR/AcrR family transcriptional regulator [Rhizobium tumorigenes]|uniref:TetR/AcrR family transcriptional regulator n=1 Tax=Rhizobium tumorigenes TaxID=2041385 RepID=UPI00241CE4BA|nr:TetR/AcrR family transcriptional regulator [Rhizobium tumorigenes]WFS03578.1 TetR/AcrR family transcriptional regulator [Rhizobium tumorigenes]